MNSDHAYALMCQRAYDGVPDYGTPDGPRAYRAMIDGRLTICFPGSRLPVEWALDFLAVPVQDHESSHKPGLGFVHAGFLLRSHNCLDLVRRDLDAVDEYVLIGHSLGGVIGLGVGGHMVLRGHPPSAIVTFGAPRFGMGPFVELMKAVKEIRQYQFGADPVPDKPPFPWRDTRARIRIGQMFEPYVENHAITNYIDAIA